MFSKRGEIERPAPEPKPGDCLERPIGPNGKPMKREKRVSPIFIDGKRMVRPRWVWVVARDSDDAGPAKYHKIPKPRSRSRVHRAARVRRDLMTRVNRVEIVGTRNGKLITRIFAEPGMAGERLPELPEHTPITADELELLAADRAFRARLIDDTIIRRRSDGTGETFWDRAMANLCSPDVFEIGGFDAVTTDHEMIAPQVRKREREAREMRTAWLNEQREIALRERDASA